MNSNLGRRGFIKTTGAAALAAATRQLKTRTLPLLSQP
jgi:hypothetical protein